MGCGTISNPPNGLVGGHAYSLISANVITAANGATIARLYRLRNPWSTDVYTGKWSDLDTVNWTPSA